MLLLGEPVLSVGDRLRIECPEMPEICVERSVGPDGAVDLPGLGPLRAATRAAKDLAREITERLPLGLLPPRVAVERLGFATGEIVVRGAVKTPLRVFAPRGIAAARLFAAAELLPGADTTLLPSASRFRPGTEIDVPNATAERRITVLGAVENPKDLPPADNLRLASVLRSAGGLTAHGDPANVVVVRGGESIPMRLPDDDGFLLRPGDLVRVGLVADRRFVTVRGLVAHPGSVAFAPGMTAKAALAAAGGPLPSVTGGVLVWLTGPKTYRLSLGFLRSGRIPDPVLGANDTIAIEAGRP